MYKIKLEIQKKKKNPIITFLIEIFTENEKPLDEIEGYLKGLKIPFEITKLKNY